MEIFKAREGYSSERDFNPPSNWLRKENTVITKAKWVKKDKSDFQWFPQFLIFLPDVSMLRRPCQNH